jgi:hypothetical protein
MGHHSLMALVWKVLAGLFLVLPTGAYVAGTIVGPPERAVERGPVAGVHGPREPATDTPAARAGSGPAGETWTTTPRTAPAAADRGADPGQRHRGRGDGGRASQNEVKGRELDAAAEQPVTEATETPGAEPSETPETDGADPSPTPVTPTPDSTTSQPPGPGTSGTPAPDGTSSVAPDGGEAAG